jgi:hypothetical protein
MQPLQFYMAIKKPREGSLLRIDLEDGMDAFARVLADAQVALYAVRVPHGAPVLPSDVYNAEVLVKLTVMKSALVSGAWTVIDHRALEPGLRSPVEYFIKDELTGRFSVYRSSDGRIRPGGFRECKSLEAAAVWEAVHVEDRLRDHFAGRPNAWTESLRASR